MFKSYFDAYERSRASAFCEVCGGRFYSRNLWNGMWAGVQRRVLAIALLSSATLSLVMNMISKKLNSYKIGYHLPLNISVEYRSWLSKRKNRKSICNFLQLTWQAEFEHALCFESEAFSGLVSMHSSSNTHTHTHTRNRLWF